MRLSGICGVLGGVTALVVALVPGVAQADAPTSPYTAIVVQQTGYPTVVASDASIQFSYRTVTGSTGNREVLRWITTGSMGVVASPVGQLLTANTTYPGGGTSSAATGSVTTTAPCTKPFSFTVHDLTRDAQNTITSIAVTIQNVACGVESELRYNSPTGYAAWDLTPQVDLGRLEINSTNVVYGTATVTSSGVTPTTIGSLSVNNTPYFTVTIASGGTCAVGSVLSYGQSCTVRLAGTLTGAWVLGLQGSGLTVTDAAGQSRTIAVTATAATTSAGNYYPTTPTRIVDTRSGLGGSSTLAPGGTMTVNPVPNASALVLNVTVVNGTVDDFLTLYPATGAPTTPPTASSINFPKGAVEANSVTVANGSAGFTVFNHAGTVDVVVDLVGYYAGGDGGHDTDMSGGQYFAHTPARVLDTRTAGLGQVPSNKDVVVPVDYGAAWNQHVRALAVNLTVTNPQASGVLAVNGASTDALYNTTSTLNFTAHATVANLAIIPVMQSAYDPAIAVANLSLGSSDIVVDVLGFYDDGMGVGGLHYHPLAPSRVLDTRQSHPIGADGTLAVTGPTAHALALNVTGIQPTTNTFLSVWPAGTTRPSASTLNLKPGEVRSNATITASGAGNQFDVYNFSGTTNAVVDVNGTFDPLADAAVPSVPQPIPGSPWIGG